MDETKPRSPKRRKISQNDISPPGINRLSRLPDDIIRRTLFLLPPGDAFAARRLCKTWLLAWASDSILDFAENDTVEPHRREPFDTHGDLVGFADHTISKLAGAELVRTLRLRLRMYGRRALERVENWLRFAGERNVRVLDIDAVTNEIPYTLSRRVLAASSLTVLKLANMEVKAADCPLSLDSLRSLTLSHVKIGDQSAHDLIASSPSLERLEMAYCFGAKTIRVANPGLGSLEIKHCRGSRLDLSEAPGLESVGFSGRAWADSGLSGPLERLRALRLHLGSLADVEGLEGRIARLPGLESLRLGWRRPGRARPARPIKICGRRLKHVGIDGLLQNVDVVVDAPNLVSLEYDKRFVSVNCFNSPNLLVA